MIAPKLGRALGPVCRCGARGTVRADYSENPALDGHGSALVRRCQSCGHVFVYRVAGGGFVPFTYQTALAIDEQRRRFRFTDEPVRTRAGMPTHAAEPTPCATSRIALVPTTEVSR